MKCHIIHHLNWVFTVCQITLFGVSGLQRVVNSCSDYNLVLFKWFISNFGIPLHPSIIFYLNCNNIFWEYSKEPFQRMPTIYAFVGKDTPLNREQSVAQLVECQWPRGCWFESHQQSSVCSFLVLDTLSSYFCTGSIQKNDLTWQKIDEWIIKIISKNSQNFGQVLVLTKKNASDCSWYISKFSWGRLTPPPPPQWEGG